MSTILDFSSSPLKESLFKKFQNKFLPWFIVNLKHYSKSLILQHCERSYFEFSRQKSNLVQFWTFLAWKFKLFACWAFLNFTEPYWDFFIFAEIYQDLLSFTEILLKLSDTWWVHWYFTEFSEILLRFYWVLLRFHWYFTEFYLDFYWV